MAERKGIGVEDFEVHEVFLVTPIRVQHMSAFASGCVRTCALGFTNLSPPFTGGHIIGLRPDPGNPTHDSWLRSGLTTCSHHSLSWGKPFILR